MPSPTLAEIKRLVAWLDANSERLITLDGICGPPAKNSIIPKASIVPFWVCAFCGKVKDAVESLIVGQWACICDECVADCVEIIEAQKRGSLPTEDAK